MSKTRIYFVFALWSLCLGYWGVIFTEILKINKIESNRKIIREIDHLFMTHEDTKSRIRLIEQTAYLCVDERENRHHGITKSGDRCKEDYSAAVDTSVIPFGTKIWNPVLNKWFVAHDTGNMIKGNRIDFAVKDRRTAMNIGRNWIVVTLRKD